ncbi:3-hydroxyacyl-[acyl-carrier-protein] dehydratase FabZ [Iodidimonas nitroreducens]|uniref:3-hydroxyacyl-[acyl-carrier-protein] dehydratase FabZ n=1 Tax=Iodidimonas nitroreducens TaxID=1236968 RepID=A0A5A7N3U0_9PROT|nr:3-hydroxyacyl-ACP dehydratase FabZ [Iodidimonas nitroreducens]GAK32802.1 3-hydroxyacyl-[acyl-carrier-protein] dehydratase FabZ [alpha proteobacterium Q-1]GER02942.1 3-hydroxyacyl-[acyl-carrier-protein] dehydratase FabZ [Iodidimonas nitroreducens]
MSELDVLDIGDIVRKIPHRFPFLLVDRVKDIVPGEKATGIKNVTINEPFFPGHFPERPVMPGVLIIEAMAQTCGILVVHSLGEEAEGRLVYFMSIDNARFRKPVTPGDVLHLEVVKERSRGNVWRFACLGKVEGAVVAQATVAAMLLEKDAG